MEERMNCELCGREIDMDDRCGLSADVEDVFGKIVCNECANNEYGYCASCSDLNRIDSMMYSENRDDYVCEDCYDSNDDNSLSVNFFKYDREFFNRGEFREVLAVGEVKTSNTRFFGVEVELDSEDRWFSPNQALKTLEDKFASKRWYALFYPKGDCSLTNGIEFLSQPMTLKAHYEHYWGEFFATAMTTGLRGHDARNAGLHVHINKDAFGPKNSEESDLNQAKLILLYDVMREELIRFSRRSESSLEEYSDFYGVVSTNRMSRGLDNINRDVTYFKNAGRKMQVVNFFHEDTVEVRLFKATGKLETFYAALEFCDLSVDVVTSKELPEILNYTFNDFMELAISKGYVNFIKYVHRRRIGEFDDDASLEACLSRIPQQLKMDFKETVECV